MAKPVVVIGAGCAGLAAAVRLAAAGRRVLVLEQAPRLGGRATAFTDRVTGHRVDNGQHALFGCYTETYGLLRTLSTDHLAPLDPQLALTMADVEARTHSLRCPALPAPWHLLVGALRWRALPWRERLALVGLRGFFETVRREGVDAAVAAVAADLTVAAWLRAQGQGTEVCRWLWEPLTLAALNQRMDVAAARVFARVIAELFGGAAEAAAIGVPRVPLDALYAQPAADFVRARHGEVRVRTAARLVATPSGRVAVAIDGVEVEAAAVVSAVPWHAFPELWIGPPPVGLSGIVDRARLIAAEPIVTVHLWLDRPVLFARQVGLVGTTFQWAFQNDVGHRFRGRSAEITRKTPSYASKTMPDVVSMVASGATDVVRRGNADLRDLAVRELRQCVPAARQAVVDHAVVVREPRATFSVAPSEPSRPTTRTTVPGLYLAGDWTDTGLPATIEGAVRSGNRAADAVLADGDDV